MQHSIHFRIWGWLAILLLAISFFQPGSGVSAQQGDNPNPPSHVVKLIFIHHSTGENWLRDDYGGLGHQNQDRDIGR